MLKISLRSEKNVQEKSFPIIIQEVAGQSSLKQESNQALLRTIQRGKSKTPQHPFFFLHGDMNEGTPFYCIALSRNLGSEQPFYSLSPFHCDGLHPLPPIEVQATAYIQLMRSIQPEGPYLLGGYCNGGMAAYEMTQQLHAVGQSVDLLTLIDAPVLPAHTRNFHKVINKVGTILHMNEDQKWFLFLRMRHFMRRVGLYLVPSPARKERFERDLLQNNREFQKFFPSLETLHTENMALLTWVFGHYSWKPSLGKVMLIWNQDEPWFKQRWLEYVQIKDTEHYTIPGDHNTIVTEHIKILAENLRSWLYKPQA